LSIRTFTASRAVSLRSCDELQTLPTQIFRLLRLYRSLPYSQARTSQVQDRRGDERGRCLEADGEGRGSSGESIMRIVTNDQRRFAVELERTKKFAKFVIFTPHKKLHVSHCKTEAFDKCWVTHEHLQWEQLRSNFQKCVIRKGVGATGEVCRKLNLSGVSMLLVVDNSNKFAAKYALDEEKTVSETIPPTWKIVRNQDDLAQMSAVVLGEIYLSLDPENAVVAIDKLKGNPSFIMKLSVAKKIWEIGLKLPLSAIEKPSKKIKTKETSEELLSRLTETNPRVTAIMETFRTGGTKDEILSNSEFAFSGETRPSPLVRQHFNIIFPALLIGGLLDVEGDNFKLKL
jgi:hypothetical protein